MLRVTRQDRSEVGLRDYAVLLLLARYGMRASEIIGLRLEDIDWSAETFWVRHTKTRSISALPLLPEVGDAILAYLRRGRPKTTSREIFIRTHAPRVAFTATPFLNGMIRRRVAAAGVKLSGKHGPHAFRHARAVTLLRAAVSVKTIGDVLGHRSSASITPYLKLHSEELRAVGLPLPASAEKGECEVHGGRFLGGR